MRSDFVGVRSEDEIVPAFPTRKQQVPGAVMGRLWRIETLFRTPVKYRCNFETRLLNRDFRNDLFYQNHFFVRRKKQPGQVSHFSHSSLQKFSLRSEMEKQKYDLF